MEFSKFLSSNKIVSRQYALEHNLPRYFTGEPCIHGHIAERNTKKSSCTECQKTKRLKKIAKRRKLAKGNKSTYSTGKPCIHGHIAERFVANNVCVECKKIQREKASRKAGMLPRDERNKLRKEAADKKKKERQQKYQESKLNKKEKEIVDYARKCLRQMYQKQSKYRQSYLLPMNVAELENSYSTEELNDYLYSLRPSWRTKRKWHVDHIIPLSRLVKKGVTELYILNSLDNLQLLTPTANMKKGTKLVVSEDKVDEFIANKLYTRPLGLYNQKERVKKLVNMEAERIYKVITSSISRTNFRIKSSKKVAIKAIKSDMWDGRYDFFSEQSSYSGLEIYDEFERQGGFISKEGLMYLLYEGYQPLKKIISESKKHSDFKYREDAQKYFERQERTCNDAVAKVYFIEQNILSGNLKEKGFFRRLF